MADKKKVQEYQWALTEMIDAYKEVVGNRRETLSLIDKDITHIAVKMFQEEINILEDVILDFETMQDLFTELFDDE